MTNEALAGTGVKQSPEEWDARNRILAAEMIALINRFCVPTSVDAEALDVGCQGGDLTDAVAQETPFAWQGIDPSVTEATTSSHGLKLLPGTSDAIPFADQTFEVALLANVYEHIFPHRRRASWDEMHRVLKPGGKIVGQIPNPWFPIESHSRLPFMGWLPISAQKQYWKLTPMPWEHDFYSVGIRRLRRVAEEHGFHMIYKRNFNYPLEVIPQAMHRAATLAKPVMSIYPWAWQFVLQRV